MNTGTPLDLTPFGVVLQGIGLLYWLIVFVVLATVLWKVKGGLMKAILATVVLTIMIGPVAVHAVRKHNEQEQRKARYAKANALFDERCKTAGEKIYRTVEDVEGVFIMKPRTEALNYDKQFKLDDPYGYGGDGEGYLKLFIRGRPTIPTHVNDIIDSKNIVSYRFLEIADPKEEGFLRYTTTMGKVQSERISRKGGGFIPLEKIHISKRTAQYGITWEDISTHEDREYWIAGGALKIIDLNNGELLAERIGYMFDQGLGNTSGGRSPWGFARSNACPPLDERNFYFFDRVIKPKKDD